MAMGKKPPPAPVTTPIPSGLLERDPLSPKGWRNRDVGLGIVAALDRPGADTSPPNVIVNFHRVSSPPAPIFSSATAIGEVGCTGRCAELSEGPGFSCGGYQPGDFPVAGFLRACYLCRKNLDGKDIYMYRGEKAFCSTECRHRQMVAEEYRESCSHVAASATSHAPVPSGRRLFEAGIMAA